MPKFSIIIPVFNSMRYLGRSLPSVVEAAEDFQDTELILVENGSTDGSYEVLQSEYAGCAKILQIKGVTIATLRNHGARVARGE
jgi:glycosyltransferase involved in cell wall biosynthesis